MTATSTNTSNISLASTTGHPSAPASMFATTSPRASLTKTAYRPSQVHRACRGFVADGSAHGEERENMIVFGIENGKWDKLKKTARVYKDLRSEADLWHCVEKGPQRVGYGNSRWVLRPWGCIVEGEGEGACAVEAVWEACMQEVDVELKCDSIKALTNIERGRSPSHCSIRIFQWALLTTNFTSHYPCPMPSILEHLSDFARAQIIFMLGWILFQRVLAFKPEDRRGAAYLFTVDTCCG